MTLTDTRVSRRHRPPAAVTAAALALLRHDRTDACSHLADIGEWDHLRDADERSWEVLGESDEFDAFLIGWPPGGRVRFHDHGPSSGSVLVLEGEVVELTPRVRGDGSLRVERRRLSAGSVLEFAPGHIHDVVNQSDVHAVSLHVYSPRLESMTYFDLGSHGIVERETVRLRNGEPVGISAVESPLG